MTPQRKKFLKTAFFALAIFIVLSVFFVWLQYSELKAILLSEISARATAFIGQKVYIGDISLSKTSGIILHDIAVENPEGFSRDPLVRIEWIRLDLQFRELLSHRLHFKDIVVYSPRLNLLKDKKGRLNLAYKPHALPRGKPSYAYQVDEFKIVSGIAEFNNVPLYRNEDINVVINNISSNHDAKTLINAGLMYSGNRIVITGWAYLNESPKRLKISSVTEGFSLSAFRKFLVKYGIDAEKTEVDISLNSEGDTEKGVNIASNIKIKNAKHGSLTEDYVSINVNLDAFYNPEENSIMIRNTFIESGEMSAYLRGGIYDFMKAPHYAAELKIEKLNISSFAAMKGIGAKGFITSDTVHIKGEFDKTLPEISGAVYIRDASLKSAAADIRKINAKIVFLSGKKISSSVSATAKLISAGHYSLKNPSDIVFSLKSSGITGEMALTSAIRLSQLELKDKEKMNVSLKDMDILMEGTLNRGTFSGEGSLRSSGIRYAGNEIPLLESFFDIDYSRDSLMIKELELKTENMDLTAGMIKIGIKDKKSPYVFEIKDLNADYPERSAGLKDFNLYLKLQGAKDSVSGGGRFSAGRMSYMGFDSEAVSGSGGFDEHNFYIDIPHAEIFGGSVKLSAESGKTNGFYPLTLDIKAGDMALAGVTKALSQFKEIPYVLSGDIENAFFSGTVDSDLYVTGRAGLKAKNVSVSARESKRHVVKNSSLDSEIEFRGKDMAFNAYASAGKITASASGEIKDFTGQKRSVSCRVELPAVNAVEIRNTLWDIFPDSLLYAGMGGEMSSTAAINYDSRGLEVSGEVRVRDFMLEGEYGEYSIGPVNGVIPVSYASSGKRIDSIIPAFTSSEFDKLAENNSLNAAGGNYSEITAGSLRYGFKIIEDMDLLINQQDRVLNIKRFSGSMFGGKIHGAAAFDFSEGIKYRAGLLLKGLSLKRLCEGIKPIKGYISGRVDGTVNLKGSGFGLSNLIGKADFWTYSSDDEDTKISREFLKKIGGPSVKTYLGDRKFDKGIMSLYIQKGFLVFRNLELSNRNFIGMRDLSIKVAPYNNRIAIDHLLWTIIEAAERAKDK